MFHAAGQNHIRHAGLDHGRTADDRFHAGNTNPVDRYGRDRIRDTGQKSPDPGNVHGIRRIHAASKTNIIDDSGVNAGPLDRFFHGYAGDTRGGDIP